ncbi:hypothetical protein VWZ88_12690 [Phaeobacter sp. JH20_36]|uniref:hypothetical protein n=1 Tax=unclassified Phaeobacter TaxID=2621772 RepID=UPI003A863EA6
MSGFITPEQAGKLACPLARVHGDGDQRKCRAEKCIIWRWLPHSASDPRFLSAIKREEAVLAQDKAAETGQKAKPQHLYHKKAVANVMRDPEAYGVEVEHQHGYCGLGGRPEQ